MNESSSITFFTDMLRQNVMNYLSPLKWHQILRNPHYIARVTDPYIKAIPVY